jgi:aldose sugar dehydrogenase
VVLGVRWTPEELAVSVCHVFVQAARFAAIAGCAVGAWFATPTQLRAQTAVRVEVVAGGLQNPWGMAFLDGGRMVVTERPGRLRVVEPDGRVGPAVAGLPTVDAQGQGGLLDVLADGRFRENRRLYWCYAEPAEGGNRTALASGRLSEDDSRLEDVRVLFRQHPVVDSRLHFGCRIVESPDGHLFLTLGDRYSRMDDAQALDNHLGKVVRVFKDGRIPPDNPFVRHSGARAEIWSMGHRNPQGATWGPDGALWTSEHGPQGGDEINRPSAGGNHGWPVVTFGENYGGGRIGEGLTHKPGMQDPLHHWTPSIAPAGMAFLGSQRYGAAWRGSLFVASLKFRYLARLQVEGHRIVGEEKLLTELGQRLRDVREGPDGLLYLLTDERNGQVLRVLPPSR